MKCEVCLDRLEGYVDGELIGAEEVAAHLVTCADCASEFEALTAEEEIYAHYAPVLDISPSMWSAIAQRTITIDSGPRLNLQTLLNRLLTSPGFSFAGAMAVLTVAVALGVIYVRSHNQPTPIAAVIYAQPNESPNDLAAIKETSIAMRVKQIPEQVKSSVRVKGSLPGAAKPGAVNQPEMLFSDASYSTLEEQDTLKHTEQAQVLLRSVRNIQVLDDDTEIDVSYEKALSRRLLTENIVLRRDAEMSGEFPAKTLLSDLEPFLIDIANLRDKTTPDELRLIKERLRKTEIVAALQIY